MTAAGASFLFGGDIQKAIDECPIPYSVMYAIAKNEGHWKRPVGYPYIISLNGKKNAEKAKSLLGDVLFIDRRTIDCENSKKCVTIAEKLLHYGIRNIDLGAFQINYRWHPGRLADYFDTASGYRISCGILYSIVRKDGWNWNSIGKYHAYSDKRIKERALYVKRLARTVKEFNKGAKR